MSIRFAPGRTLGHATPGKLLIADYVLVYRNTKLAVRYSYATNGQGIYGIDKETEKERAERRYSTHGDIEPDLCPAECLARPIRRLAVCG